VNGTIPLKHIGDMHILTCDLVPVMQSPEVLRTFADHQLIGLMSAVRAELDRRKNPGNG